MPVRLRSARHRAGEGEAGAAGTASREARGGAGESTPAGAGGDPVPGRSRRAVTSGTCSGVIARAGQGASGRLYSPGLGRARRGSRCPPLVPETRVVVWERGRPEAPAGAGLPGKGGGGGLRGPAGGVGRRGPPECGAPLGPSRVA